MVHLVIGVCAELLDMGRERIVDNNGHLISWKRTVRAGPIRQRDRELVAVRERAGYGLARRARHGDSCRRGRTCGQRWVQHAAEELEPFEACGQPGEVAARRVTAR